MCRRERFIVRRPAHNAQTQTDVDTICAKVGNCRAEFLGRIDQTQITRTPSQREMLRLFRMSRHVNLRRLPIGRLKRRVDLAFLNVAILAGEVYVAVSGPERTTNFEKLFGTRVAFVVIEKISVAVRSEER